jgi:hypothetical protein
MLTSNNIIIIKIDADIITIDSIISIIVSNSVIFV